MQNLSVSLFLRAKRKQGYENKKNREEKCTVDVLVLFTSHYRNDILGNEKKKMTFLFSISRGYATECYQKDGWYVLFVSRF